MFADACYLAGEAEMDWTSARAWCQHNESSSDLVSIHSPLENDQVWGFMHDHGVNTWIGYTDRWKYFPVMLKTTLYIQRPRG